MNKTINMISGLIAVFTIFICNVSGQSLCDSIDAISKLKSDKNVLIYAKLSDNTYVKVRDNNWPDAVIESINVFEINGKIRSISIYPSSEAGDWFYGTENYYDANGKLIGCVERKNYFNSLCIEGSLHTTNTYINSKNGMVKIKELITDSDGKDVSKLKCDDPYKFTKIIIDDPNEFGKNLEKQIANTQTK